MKKLLIIALLLVTSIGLFYSCKKTPLGTPGNPVKFWFMPQKDPAVYEAQAPAIKDYLEKKTGYSIRTNLAPSYVDIIKALGQKDADIAFMNGLGYLLANDWAGATPLLQYVYGDVYKDYHGEFVVKVGSGINKPEDLNGKTIAFTSAYSTSGYLYPLKYLKDHNIKPAKTVFAGGHLQALEMLYRGEVDAAAVYHEGTTMNAQAHDIRGELVSKYPKIFSELKVVALTAKIPNGPIVVRKELPDEMAAKLKSALLEFAHTPEGRKTLIKLYGMTGFAPVSPKVYDGVSDVIREMGKTIQEMVPGGAPYYRTWIIPGLE